MKENKIYALKMPGKAALAVVSLALWAGHAQAGSISIFNTGAGLSQGNVDSHWSVGVSPSTVGSAFTITSPTAPVNWTPGENAGGLGSVSNWISPNANTLGTLGVNYAYRTTFNLPTAGGVALQGRWASDNKLQSIILNAGTLNQAIITTNSLGTAFSAVNNQPSWTTNPTAKIFNLAAFSGFYVAGVNTLDFVVDNNLGANTGLRVEFTNHYVPEPASLALLGLGMAGLGAMRRRKA